MSPDQIANALLLVPAVVLGAVAWRSRRRGETTLGIGPREGGGVDVLRGLAFGLVSVAVLVGLLTGTGTVRLTGPVGSVVPTAGIVAYFAVLFLVEEIVFRGWLMTGLGVVVGRRAAWVGTAVLVALPYLLSPGAGVMALLGEVIVNLVNGAARWRTGRIWFGCGLRVTWNGGLVAMGLPDSGLLLAPPVLRQETVGPAVLSGGAFGPEAGLIGMFVGVVMIGALVGQMRPGSAAGVGDEEGTEVTGAGGQQRGS